MKKLIMPLVGAAMMLGITTSCNSDSPEPESIWVTYSFTLSEEYYNRDGYWNDVYNTSQGSFGIPPSAIFSHKAQVDVYDGIEYKSFTGFCPTIVNDQKDYTGQDWTQHQFASIANPDLNGYLIAHWDVRETSATPVEDRSCLINFVYTAQPVAMTLTNTTYAYYAMRNGTAFSRPFTGDDYLLLNIYGVKDGKSFLGQSVYLARNGSFIDSWQAVDLTPLGDVQQMYFTMESSDSGEFGMNIPAYFAIGAISAIYKVE